MPETTSSRNSSQTWSEDEVQGVNAVRFVS